MKKRNLISKSTKNICLQIEDIFDICDNIGAPKDINVKFKYLIEFINYMDYMDDEDEEVDPMDFVEFLITRAYEEENYRFLQLVKDYTTLNIPVN